MKRFLFLTIGTVCLMSLQAKAGHGNGETSATKKPLPPSAAVANQEQKTMPAPTTATEQQKQNKPLQSKELTKDSTKKASAVNTKDQPVKKVTTEKEEEDIFDFFIHPFRRLEKAI